MLQIVHDVAPGANLLFHTAYASVVDLANGILALETAGADVIVDDVLYLNEPMFEDGIVAQAVDSVTANGVAYYSAAGNQGRQSYEATFRDSGEVLCFEIFEPAGDCHPLYERVGKMHDFDPGPEQHLFQSITIPYNATLAIAMQWDESFGNARIDHDVVLLDEAGGVFYEFGANDNVATGEGWEVLQYTNHDFMAGTTAFSLAITYDDVDSIDPPATLLKTIFYGNGITINDFPGNSSTLIGHANARGAAAVGAAFYLETPEFGTSPPLLEPYSSAGGTPILFAADGSLLPAPEVRLKPEFTAIDGVHTSFFFNDSTGDGYDDFFGTSAAAPHAAGVAALMLQADPTATPAQIYAALGSTAIDMLGGGFDYSSGFGLIQADAAIAALTTSDNTAPVASFTIGSITNLVVEFTDTSVDTDGTITSWSWNFGGDGVSTSQHPTHTFSHADAYTVTLTVTDNDGATDAASQLVTVTSASDTTPPSITAPADVTVEATGQTTSIALGAPSVSDNLDPEPVVTNDAPVAFPVGTTLVTWTATDASGNSASAFQMVTVTDTTSPSITAPGDIEVVSSEPVVVDPGIPVVSDLADANPMVSNDAPATFPIGTTTVIWTATDASGNSASDAQTITVTAPPALLDQVAIGETPVAGTVSGNYLNTQSDDDTSLQWITERDSGGKPSNRYSYLEHIWHFDVSPGNLATLMVNAWSSGSSDGDDFDFSYSLDGSNYIHMLTVSSTNSTNEQSFQLPGSINGSVWVRVRDTDKTAGNRAQNTVYVDYLLIRSETAVGDPPVAPSDLSTIAVSSSQIDLAWTDNASDEMGFKVERSADGGSVWTQVATVDAEIANYEDTGLSGSTTYHYRVAAFNASGTSGYTDTAYATTLAGITLNATGYKVKGVQYADLTWNGAGGTIVDVYRDETIIATPENTGTYTDNIGKKGGSSYIYAVCETGSMSNCSEPVTVTF